MFGRFDWAILFGYDVFISYKRGEGTTYARELKRKLMEADFVVFLDEDDAPVGAELSPRLMTGLRRSRKQIVLITASSVDSQWMSDEIDIYSKLKRDILPINLCGISEDALELTKIQRLAGLIWADECDPQIPSDVTISRIRSHFAWRRANRLVRFAIGIAFLVLLAISVWALIQQNNAEKQRVDAVAQRVEAVAQRTEAVSRRAEADKERKTAIEAKNAAEKARDLAQAKQLAGQPSVPIWLRHFSYP